MGYLDGLQDLFTQQITLAAFTGDNEFSESAHGIAKSYPARIERGSNLVSPAGSDRSIVAQYKVLIGEAVQVDLRDQITLPSQYNQRNESGVFVACTPIIQRVDYLNDEAGHVATVIHCG